ncbi:TIGR00659 family protein [Lentibacillus persicus]|uniref:TIGR00659 family protein n=1 Tax=Lentibacillus persicus TaxID=640948 RepID=A0A1I1TSU0_9BACI|nr:LrgB family protein [Lentibacillus persicus]SFD60298.1 TIGR00659 family protein [Lentibacillus persicus]
MSDVIIGLSAVAVTIVCYLIGLSVYRRWNYTFMAPVIIATLILILILLFFQIPYDMYMIGGGWINHLLGPAVVALAYPLYEHRNTLKRLTIPILSGTVIGGLVGISSGILLSKWAGVDKEIIYSLIPKNSTTPVAMEVAAGMGGIEPLAAVFVMIAGIGGSMLSSFVLRFTRVDHYIGSGVGIGSASHAIGTAIAMERDSLEGSVSTIAMVVSAVVVSVLAPLLAELWV